MSQAKNNNNATVTIYSTTWCSFCRMAKNYLQGLDVTFKEIDIDKDTEAASYIINKTHQAGVPIIEIGESTIIGFDRPKIDAALAKNNLV